MKRIGLTLGLIGLLGDGPAAARLSVSVDPNALERVTDGMRVLVKWPEVADGTAVELRILRDCNGDASPDTRDEDCPGKGVAVLRRWQGATKSGLYEERISLSGLPEGERLWLRAGDGPASTSALFFVAQDRCSIWKTVLDGFRRGACRVGVLDAMEQLLGDSDERPEALLEVRLLDPRKRGPGTPISGTAGATGVAWLSPSALLVTRKHTDAQTKAGLYEVQATAKPTTTKLLWLAEPGVTPTAPLAENGRVLLVLEKHHLEADGVVSWLGVLQNGKVIQRVPLYRSVHQLLALAGDRVLLYSRWQGRPEFVMVELQTGLETSLGRDGALLDALYRAPRGEVTVWAEPDRANDMGWDLWILNNDGKHAQPLLRRAEHDLMPTWRPDGQQIAYLGERTVKASAP